MVFGDETVSKTSDPTESRKKNRKKKKEKEKQRKRKRNNKKKVPTAAEILWKKKSIFFRLSYWKNNLLRHNLDVMNIEKNVMDNILGTILDIKGKTKDNLQASKDLQEIGLRPKLHLYTGDEGKMYLPLACHTMSNEDKTTFLKCFEM
jgi:hypothetical protein